MNHFTYILNALKRMSISCLHKHIILQNEVINQNTRPFSTKLGRLATCHVIVSYWAHVMIQFRSNIVISTPQECYLNNSDQINEMEEHRLQTYLNIFLALQVVHIFKFVILFTNCISICHQFSFRCHKAIAISRICYNHD